MEREYFEKGAEVEVFFDDPAFRGAWFTATVLRPPNREKKIFLQYHTLLAEEGGSKRLQERVKSCNVRPVQPREEHRTFKMGEEVDAFHDDGWWEGAITKAHTDDRFTVYFRGSKEQIVFPASELRLHREWVDTNWVPPLEEVHQDNMPKPEGSNVLKPEGQSKELKLKFKKGTQVEINTDEEGYVGAWFEATYVKKVGKKYMVVHKHFTTGNGKPLKEQVDDQHIRPPPPKIPVDRFKLADEVDAWHKYAWWVGVISKPLQKSKCMVYFRSTKDELTVKKSDLRLHQDWSDGQWIKASSALNL